MLAVVFATDISAVLSRSVLLPRPGLQLKIRGIRFSTLEALCEALDCQPGDLIEYVTQEEYEAMMALKRPRAKEVEAPKQAQSDLAAAAAHGHTPADMPAIGLSVVPDLGLQV